jgi:parafibromin
MQLKSWLDGSGVGEESEYIRPLEADKATADALGSAAVASGAIGGIPTITGAGVAAAQVKGLRSEDPRLAEIYRGERTMGDRNTILRGIKPTVGIPAFNYLLNANKYRTSHTSGNNAIST